MANTYTSIYIHYVFSTKNRVSVLGEKIRERLWAYIGGIARDHGMAALRVGGVTDHVHALVALPATVSIARGVQLIKGGSSRWMHETFPEIADFAWQEGYGAFSVSKSHVEETVAYIERQKEHHRERSFQEEYLAFLRKHEIAYDERYIWD